jgi:hypothetical protein
MLTTLANPAILKDASPFIVATPLNRPFLDPNPFGITTRWFIDPFDTRQAPFLFQLQRLDRLTFGPAGMPMARWIFYNMAEVPGFIYGFAIPAETLSPDERGRLEVPPDFTGPVPVSMYIAVPTRAPGVWFGHNLASLNRLLPERGLTGLGTVTKALGLAAFRVQRSMGATQWSSHALHIHARLGPLRLSTAWTPAHSLPATLTYAWQVEPETLRDVLAGRDTLVHRPTPTRWLDVNDFEGMQQIQRELEAGKAWMIAAPPVRDAAGNSRIPLVPVL